MAALKEAVAKEGPIANEFLTNAISSGLGSAEKWKLKTAATQLARMKAKLNLTAAQEEAINKMQIEKIRIENERVMKTMTGKITPEEIKADADAKNSFESQVKALLTSDQLATYPEYQHSETLLEARNLATAEASTIVEDFKLSAAQKEQAYIALYQQQLDLSAKEGNKKPTIVIGDEDSTTLLYEWQKRILEEKLQLLSGILTSEQLKIYEAEKLAEMERQHKMMKSMLPKKTAANVN